MTLTLQKDEDDRWYKDTNDNRWYFRDDRTPYAIECLECGGAWKVYQSSYHAEDCSKKI